MQKRKKTMSQLNKECRAAANGGFSLVELLIAVTILAIVVIPLLHGFITSHTINVRSRKILRATTVAQDIMEGLKAYTLEEVRTQFEPPEGTSGSSYYYPREGFYILNSNMIQGGVREITELETPGEEIYYFGLENVKLQGSEYDALIKLDASTYGDKAKDKTGDTNALHDREFNGTFYAEVGSVAEVNGGGDEAMMATDSSYHQNVSLNEGVLKHVQEQITADGKTYPADQKLEDILDQRTIEVKIEDDGTEDNAGNKQCRATITFTYKCTYDGVAYTSNGYAASLGGEVDGVKRTFSSGNFYLFYYPIYSLTKKYDYIEFQIDKKLLQGDEPMLRSIVLAKQIESDVDTVNHVIAPKLSAADLLAYESSYKADVKINTGGSIENDLIYRTNIDMNMANGTDISPAQIQQDLGDPAHVKQCGFSGSNVSDKVTNVIYDIEITVYQTGAAQHFAETDFEDNDDVHKLASITNLD